MFDWILDDDYFWDMYFYDDYFYCDFDDFWMMILMI